MRKNSTYMALLGPTCLLISEKSATYTIKWSYMIIWQVRVRTFLLHKVRENCRFLDHPPTPMPLRNIKMAP